MGVDYETDGRVAHLRINRPEARNAMDPAAYVAMQEAIARFESDDRLAVAIVSGAGDHFTVGGDMNAYAARPVEQWRDDGPRSPSVEQQARMWDCRKPLIAAIQGYCVGWGTAVLVASDVRVLAADARIGFTNLRVFGGAATGGYVERLLVQVPYARAIDLLLTGRLITADEALGFDLATEVCPRDDLLATAERWAARLLESPPAVLRVVKAAARRVQDAAVGRLYEQTERDGLAFLASEDFAEAMAAWSERRPPDWTGR